MRWGSALLDRTRLRRARQAGRVSTGRAGERAAAKFLKRLGYRVVDRNVPVGRGEADLICLDPSRSALIVVEVKARRIDPGHPHASPPAEAGITGHKRDMLRHVAQTAATRLGLPRHAVRIDVVAVDLPREGRRPVGVRHYPSSVG